VTGFLAALLPLSLTFNISFLVLALALLLLMLVMRHSIRLLRRKDTSDSPAG
jgi:hypothetical protein